MKKFLVILLAAVLFCGCVPEKQEQKITVYATLFPQYDFCRAIAGDKVEVKLLLPFGMESHNYEPGVQDIKNIYDCRLFLYTGAQMESWAQRILESINNSVKVVDLSEGIEMMEEEHLEHHEHREQHDQHHQIDPHIWTSPKNAKKMAENILNALCDIDSRNSEFYIKNAQNYFKELDRLDKEFAELGEKTKNITLCHGGKFSLGYLTKDYGIEFLSALDSCESNAEPSVKRVKEICEKIKDQNLKAVFYEELSVGKVADTVKSETGVEKLLLHSCHNVTKQEFNSGATYVSLMEQNIKNIKKAMGII